MSADELGLGGGLSGDWRNLDTNELAEELLSRGGFGGTAFGIPAGFGVGTGAGVAGGFALSLSGSDEYDESRIAPVSMPPRLLSFGIPPVNRPPSCGASFAPEFVELPP